MSASTTTIDAGAFRMRRKSRLRTRSTFFKPAPPSIVEIAFDWRHYGAALPRESTFSALYRGISPAQACRQSIPQVWHNFQRTQTSTLQGCPPLSHHSHKRPGGVVASGCVHKCARSAYPWKHPLTKPRDLALTNWAYSHSWKRQTNLRASKVRTSRIFVYRNAQMK